MNLNNQFEIVVVDNESKYLNISKKRILNFKKEIKDKKNNISFLFSDVTFSKIDNQYCNIYKKIPLCNPDFIYLDGPNLFKIKNTLNNFTNSLFNVSHTYMFCCLYGRNDNRL